MTKAVFLLLLVPALAFAQGQILFANNDATAITNGDTVQRASIATKVGFYVNPNPNAYSYYAAGWVMIGSTNLAAPGIFLAGVRDLPSSFPAGTPVAVQVRVWLATESFDSLEAFWVAGSYGAWGVSDVMQITPTSAPAAPPTLIGSGLIAFAIRSPIPEPSTLALAGLGLASLAWGKLARRRQPDP